MGRRHTAGVVGYQAVGGVQVDNTTFTAAENLDIVMDPSGTGLFKIAGDAQLQAQGDLRFADADNSNYVAFQAPSTISSDLTWTLPATDGSSNQVLTTNGSGTLSWSTAAVTITDNTSDSAVNYVAFTTATSGTITAARVSSTKFTFQPSTGTLSASAANINGTVNQLYTENVTTVSKTIQLADRDKVVACTNTSDITITLPDNATVAFPTGSRVYIYRKGTGNVTIAAGGSAVLNKTGDAAQGEEFYCRKRDTNEWVIVDAPSISYLSGTGGTLTTAGGFNQHTYTSAGQTTFVVN